MSVKKFVQKGIYYLLPEDAQAMESAEGTDIYINGKVVEDIDRYQVTREQYATQKSYRYLMPLYPFQRFLAEQYANIAEFLNKNKGMTYLEFDSKTCDDMVLFSFLPKFDFGRLDATLDSISRTMPYIMNIFFRPVIHLESEEFIMPVYAVKVIDRNTVRHIMSHPEHWKSIDNGKIKPARLLTRVYEDDYTIYENKVFCRTTDQIVSILKRHKNVFADIIYNKISFELSVINKTNHLYHYLALGKLYVGYAKTDELFAERCEDYINRFDRIIGKITANHAKPIYRKNRKSRIGRTLRKTNILAMHKDYRHIFTLKKALDRADYPAEYSELTAAVDDVRVNYENFCTMLSVFAVGHFRFRANDELIFEQGKFVGISYKFQKWQAQITQVTIACLDTTATLMTVSSKGRRYRTLLIPYMADIGKEDKELAESILRDVAREYRAENYIFLTAEKFLRVPTYYSSGEISMGIMPLSINDINSFKRLQRLLLNAMVQVSNPHDICPFCGGVFEKENNIYLCKKCKTELTIYSCYNCGEDFCATAVKYPALKERIISSESYSKENYWKYCQDKDAHLNYRNITDLTEDAKPICPHCNTAVRQ